MAALLAEQFKLEAITYLEISPNLWNSSAEEDQMLTSLLHLFEMTNEGNRMNTAKEIMRKRDKECGGGKRGLTYRASKSIGSILPANTIGAIAQYLLIAEEMEPN